MRYPLALLLAAAVALSSAVAAGARTTPHAHGQLLHVRANTNQSSNWFGYNQGSLEQGGTLFTSITGDWTVPAASQHTAGQAEDSSDWIGIGGGCVDAGCTVGDSTLIQTGTEQDVDASGNASYSAWWELVPAPSISIANMTVSAGDRMHASIAEVVAGSNLWAITLQDVTRGETFTQTVPYSSTHLTAEWIEETPLELGADAGFASLPNLSNPAFSAATVNGHTAGLTGAEAVDLIDATGDVIGTPSAPNASADGFDACAWATTCS